MSQAGDAEHFARLWNRALSSVAVFNLLAWTVLYFKASKARKPVRQPPHSFFSWDTVHNNRRWLALFYVVACGIRSVWPRMDGDRVCFWEHPLSPPLIGRSLAYVAELCFAALVCLTLTRVINTPAVRRLAKDLFVANFVAQNCCTYAVITRDQRGHVIEESIWLLSGLTIVLTVVWHLIDARRRSVMSGSPQARSFIRYGVLVGGTLFVTFMTLVDVPMYYNRSLEDAELNRVFASFTQGIAEISTCTINRSDAFWIPEMPWMSGYFSFGVWAAIWMANCSIEPRVLVQAPVSEKVRAPASPSQAAAAAAAAASVAKKRQ